LDFSSALDAAAAIKAKKVSSVELTQRMFERIDKYNPKLNAFAYQMRDRALAEAHKADDAIARKKQLGAFHGVPFCVKECFAVEGEPDTWGIPTLKNSKAPANSAAVERLLTAGGVLMGGTNVPYELGDWQSYNDIYGTTNNPWDVTRTPGGSSGGCAAALAAGLTYLSVGTDIGGSLRVPADFCGIFSHKPTIDLVSTRGMIPGGHPGSKGFSTDLHVAGPMARSARDLMMALKLLGGPDGYDEKAWSWKLPPPRKRTLKDFRVGFVIESSLAMPTSDVKPLLEAAVAAVERAGAQLKPGWPAQYKLEEALENYEFLLAAFIFSTLPKEEQQQRLERMPANTPFGAGYRASHADWLQQRHKQLSYRAMWQTYFEQVDVFLLPVSFTVPMKHDHSQPMFKREIETVDGKRPYMDLLPWMGTATLTGCPASVAPIGRTAAGLPVGIQIMGPFWGDATPIEFAELLAKEVGGFAPPPGYSG
jgi:amidase